MNTTEMIEMLDAMDSKRLELSSGIQDHAYVTCSSAVRRCMDRMRLEMLATREKLVDCRDNLAANAKAEE